MGGRNKKKPVYASSPKAEMYKRMLRDRFMPGNWFDSGIGLVDVDIPRGLREITLQREMRGN